MILDSVVLDSVEGERGHRSGELLNSDEGGLIEGAFVGLAHVDCLLVLVQLYLSFAHICLLFGEKI